LPGWQDDAMEDRVGASDLIPLPTRVHLSHAVVESLAREAGVDLLHIKGPALLPGLRPPTHGSTDVDVLVRPGHVDRLEAALARHGWDRRSAFDTGSAFQHAANWFHDNWGYVDVHATWPGPKVSPEQVYAELAAGDLTQEIAHFACRVPNRTGQILILVLHAARTVGGVSDLPLAWHAIAEEERSEVRAMASRLRAETALAAGLGELDSIFGDPTADLWRYYSLGGTRLDEWRARLRAAPTRRDAVRVVAGAIAVNRDHLAMELGRTPTRRDVAVAQLHRVQVLGRELAAVSRERLSRLRIGRS
jgi:Uncharacterised nucleotidyltransferase